MRLICKGPLLLSKFSIKNFVKELEGRIGGKSCKHEKMAPTLTNYENIAVTLCLISIAILRRRLRDRARVRRRATTSWLLRRRTTTSWLLRRRTTTSWLLRRRTTTSWLLRRRTTTSWLLRRKQRSAK